MFGFNKPRYSEISVADAASDLQRYRVVDVRTASEFHGDLGHVPGSELVPLNTLAAAARHWDPAVPLLVVCRSGRRAASACSALARAGFQSVTNLRGGMMAWAAHGLPTGSVETAA